MTCIGSAAVVFPKGRTNTAEDLQQGGRNVACLFTFVFALALQSKRARIQFPKLQFQRHLDTRHRPKQRDPMELVTRNP